MSQALPLEAPFAALPEVPVLESRAPAAAAAHRRAPLRAGLILVGIALMLLLVAAVAPQLLTSVDPLDADAGRAFLAPSAAHPLGTDENGRDVLARLIHGVRPSLTMGLAATALGIFIGTALGLAAGLGRRLTDSLVSRFLDTLMAFPDMLLALVIITFWGPGTVNAILAIAFASVPRNARLVRAQAQVIRRSSFVEAARTLGLHTTRIAIRHILPNAVKPVLLIAAISVGNAIAAGAALSFLGFGAPPPAAEWGAMLATGRNYLPTAWWLVAAPALAIAFTVLTVTAAGRALLRRSEGLAA